MKHHIFSIQILHVVQLSRVYSGIWSWRAERRLDRTSFFLNVYNVILWNIKPSELDFLCQRKTTLKVAKRVCYDLEFLDLYFHFEAWKFRYVRRDKIAMPYSKELRNQLLRGHPIHNIWWNDLGILPDDLFVLWGILWYVATGYFLKRCMGALSLLATSLMHFSIFQAS